MEKDTNEKSLIVVEDNFFKRIKNFFVRFFWSKNEEQYDQADVEETKRNEIIKEEVSETKERKLYNFDADDTGEWPENINISIETDEQNIDEEKDSDTEREPISEACREKEELEQKLRNYYASITKMSN